MRPVTNADLFGGVRPIAREPAKRDVDKVRAGRMQPEYGAKKFIKP